MENVLKKLSSVKLTRKEFLLWTGTLFLGILGISSLLKLISEVNPTQKQKASNFGSGPYGV